MSEIVKSNPYPFHSQNIKSYQTNATLNYLKLKTDLEEIGIFANKNNKLKDKLKTNKNLALKSMMYSNIDIPSQWARKLDYKSYIYSIFKDQKLEKYMRISYPTDNIIKENTNIKVSDNTFLKNYKNMNFLDIESVQEKRKFNKSKNNIDGIVLTANNNPGNNNNAIYTQHNLNFMDAIIRYGNKEDKLKRLNNFIMENATSKGHCDNNFHNNQTNSTTFLAENSKYRGNNNPSNYFLSQKKLQENESIDSINEKDFYQQSENFKTNFLVSPSINLPTSSRSNLDSKNSNIHVFDKKHIEEIKNAYKEITEKTNKLSFIQKKKERDNYHFINNKELNSLSKTNATANSVIDIGEPSNLITDNNRIKKASKQHELLNKNTAHNRSELDREAQMYFSMEKEREKNHKRHGVGEEMKLHMELLEFSKKNIKSTISKDKARRASLYKNKSIDMNCINEAFNNNNHNKQQQQQHQHQKNYSEEKENLRVMVNDELKKSQSKQLVLLKYIL